MVCCAFVAFIVTQIILFVQSVGRYLGLYKPKSKEDKAPVNWTLGMETVPVKRNAKSPVLLFAMLGILLLSMGTAWYHKDHFRNEISQVFGNPSAKVHPSAQVCAPPLNK